MLLLSTCLPCRPLPGICYSNRTSLRKVRRRGTRRQCSRHLDISFDLDFRPSLTFGSSLNAHRNEIVLPIFH